MIHFKKSFCWLQEFGYSCCNPACFCKDCYFSSSRCSGSVSCSGSVKYLISRSYGSQILLRGAHTILNSIFAL